MQDTVVDHIARERADLLALLQRVGPADWDRGTACAPWTVKDVLAHLVEGELQCGRVYRGEVRTSGYIDPETRIAKWRALPGEAVRASLWQHGVATQRVLEAMTDASWRQPIQIFGCREIRQLVRLHLFDLAVHGHDLAAAIDAPPVWEPRLHFLTEFVARAAAPTLRRRGVAARGRVAFSAGEVAFVLGAQDDAWHLELGAIDAPCVVTIGQADLVLTVTGRMPIADALDRAKVEGARADAEALLNGWQVLAQS